MPKVQAVPNNKQQPQMNVSKRQNAPQGKAQAQVPQQNKAKPAQNCVSQGKACSN